MWWHYTTRTGVCVVSGRLGRSTASTGRLHDIGALPLAVYGWSERSGMIGEYMRPTTPLQRVPERVIAPAVLSSIRASPAGILPSRPLGFLSDVLINKGPILARGVLEACLLPSQR